MLQTHQIIASNNGFKSHFNRDSLHLLHSYLFIKFICLSFNNVFNISIPPNIDITIVNSSLIDAIFIDVSNDICFNLQSYDLHKFIIFNIISVV